MGEDELGAVVRGHIYVETRVLELLALVVTHQKYLKDMQLDYFQRVNLAVALGLNPEHARPLLALGKLRNDFAHNLGMTLSESRVNSLYETLSSGDKTLVHQAYDLTKAQRGETLPSFKKLTPKDRFTLITVALHSLLGVAIQDIRSAQ